MLGRPTKEKKRSTIAMNTCTIRPANRGGTLMRGLLAFLAVFVSSSALAADYKPIVLDPSYEHDRFMTRFQNQPTLTAGNYVRKFRAYISVFDGEDDDNGDGQPDFLGIPHFVAYEVKRFEGTLPAGPERPNECSCLGPYGNYQRRNRHHGRDRRRGKYRCHNPVPGCLEVQPRGSGTNPEETDKESGSRAKRSGCKDKEV